MGATQALVVAFTREWAGEPTLGLVAACILVSVAGCIREWAEASIRELVEDFTLAQEEDFIQGLAAGFPRGLEAGCMPVQAEASMLARVRNHIEATSPRGPFSLGNWRSVV